jgi:hypothetical protein
LDQRNASDTALGAVERLVRLEDDLPVVVLDDNAQRAGLIREPRLDMKLNQDLRGRMLAAAEREASDASQSSRNPTHFQECSAPAL